MRRLVYILFALLAFAACSREMEQEILPIAPDEEVDDAPEGSVTVHFGITVPAETDPSTKALGEDFVLDNLYLAVFGSSGYYKQYVKASQVGNPVQADILYKEYEDEQGQDVKIYKKVWTYKFEAKINLSNTSRTIHFLGNMDPEEPIDIGYARDVLPKLLGTKETAFWQMITLKSISGKVDEYGQYIDGDPNAEGIQYIVSDETEKAFSKDNGSGGIALVRNWAKIVLRNNYPTPTALDPVDKTGSHFTPKSFAIINYPAKGTVLPFGGETGFIEDYHLKSFDQLYNSPLVEEPKVKGLGYRGNLPAGVDFVDPFYDDPDDDEDKPIIAQYFEHPDVTDPLRDPLGRVVKYNAAYDSDAPSDVYNPATEYLDDEPAVYLYERPVPSDDMPPSYVIVYGKYYNPDDKTLKESERLNGVDCYYKIDLMADGEYYPILRNFKYQISIKSITSRGKNTPQEAATSAGSADVSADITASHLADISDGTRRMAIQYWMSKSFYQAMTFQKQLDVVFYDDINDVDRDGDGNTDGAKYNTYSASVWYRLIPDDASVVTRRLDDQKNDVSVVIGEAVQTPGASDYGFRPISFGINDPHNSTEIKTQTLRIYCKSDPSDLNETPLYRDIVLSLMPPQPLKISFSSPRILRYRNQAQEIYISIPDGLPESMFPLTFRVEPLNMTLTPDKTKGDLPIVYGNSITAKEGENKPVFYFEKVVSWEDYKAQHAVMDFDTETYWRTFTCYFKTNYEYSGTDVYVSNEYFITNHEAFFDYRSFKTASLTTSVPAEDGGAFSMSGEVEKEPNGEYQTIYLALKNATPDQATKDAYGMEQDVTDGRWNFTLPSSGKGAFTLSFTTVGDASEVGDPEITLSAKGDEFEPVTLKPYHFTNVGFIPAHLLPNTTSYSNVAFDHVNNANNKTTLFGFCVDATFPKSKTHPVVYFKKVNANTNMNYNGNSEFSINVAKQTRSADYTGSEYFYWVTKNTVGNTIPVQFKMSATGYLEHKVVAGRFKEPSNIYTVDVPMSTSGLEAGKDVSVEKSDKQKVNNKDVYSYFDITFDKISQVTDEGVVLEKGGTYEIEISARAASGKETELFYVQFDYAANTDKTGNPPKKPAMVIPLAPDDDANDYVQYLGSQYEYMWTLPRGVTGENNKAKIKMIAPTNEDIVITHMLIKGFRGDLFD